MLALYRDKALADTLGSQEGWRPGDLHVTVAYTGDADQVDQRRLHAAAEIAARRLPFTAQISGHARFTGGEQDVIVALVDAPQSWSSYVAPLWTLSPSRASSYPASTATPHT
jgi:2'-5' RNA ligase